MKKGLVATLLFTLGSIYAASEVEKGHALLAEKVNAPASEDDVQKPSSKQTITMQYEGEDIVDIINALAADKGLNIVLPSGTDALGFKVNLHLDEPQTIDDAWDILLTLLELGGYSYVPRGGLHIIERTSKETAKEPLPLYVGTKPGDIPATAQRIRYIGYLANFKIAEDEKSDATGGKSEIGVVLKEMLPDTAFWKLDPANNSILIADKASNIKSAMEVITALDDTTFQEKLEIIHLTHTQASTVAKIFTDNILRSDRDLNRYRLDTRRGTEETYFSKYIKIIPENRTNSLIVLGKTQAIERLKEFIFKYIDVELETGNSILHTYELLYLDAAAFAEVLTKIVTSEKGGGTGQAKAGEAAGGIERFFENVIIKSDSPRDATTGYAGSNTLIVAARHDDWIRIKELIEELDKPQPQVILEVLIADLTQEDFRQIATQLRNPAAIPLPGTANFQSAQLTDVIIPSNISNTSSIGATPPPGNDLLAQTTSLKNSSGSNTNYAAGAPAKATLITLNDPNTGFTYGIMQLLKTFDHKKVLSHPHVIAINNKTAKISIGEQRLLADEATSSNAGATTIKKIPQEATLDVSITPRISSHLLEEAPELATVSLHIEIGITDFLPLSDARSSRTVKMDAIVKSKEILALGGLIRNTVSSDLGRTPILGQLPIIGYLFKAKQQDNLQTNLTIFICPTVITPRLRGGAGTYTKDYIKVVKNYSKESSLFDSLRDPVTRWFFKAGDESSDVIDAFLAKDELKQDALDQPTTQRPRAPKSKKDKAKTKKANELAAKKQETDEEIKAMLEMDQSSLRL